MTLRLSIDETDPALKKSVSRYSDWKAFLVLRRCLEPDGDLSIEQATVLIHEMMPTAAEGRRVAPGLFGALCLDVADKVSYSHPAQSRLVELLDYLQASDRMNERQFCDFGDCKGYSIYYSMEDLKMEIRERYSNRLFLSMNTPWDHFEPGTPEEQEYVNISAFIARLTAAGLVDAMSWAVWTMKENLEDVVTGNRYSGCVSAAAMWILCAGQWLFIQIVQAPEEDDESPRP
ncbi:hypothetical protein BO94DRAFT_602115 [Aspergillus sclerotioniger CBS 115572]|uniref:Uncharacterized protein n=1 Tax=Aspergillus sclerotioniger CBS 115572 TaxID=1450535 RepID=A0A317W5C3_9EURO|nr:hypothetical protein BO94DRAFT_602115 [Aspergillus sclerotioniger CBS 115572]PWY80791.1 hypothetical protein BO94DRAFT_602115 [Aspergillus sclerotioniger CBS 115572]